MDKKKKSKFTENQQNFLTAFANIGGRNVSLAAHNVDLCREVVYLWIKNSPEFAKEKELVSERCTARVECALYMKAINNDFGSICKWLDNRKSEDWQDRRNISIKHETPTMVDLIDQIRNNNNGNGKKVKMKDLTEVNN